MPEHDTVRGMVNDQVAGPPYDPPSHTVIVPPQDQFNRGRTVHGDPANKPRQFIETTSPELSDITSHLDPFDENDPED